MRYPNLLKEKIFILIFVVTIVFFILPVNPLSARIRERRRDGFQASDTSSNGLLHRGSSGALETGQDRWNEFRQALAGRRKNQGLYPRVERSRQQGKAVQEREEIPDHSPALTIDEQGNMYLVWEHGNELWWAINKGEGFKTYGKIPGAEGAKPVIVTLPTLPGQERGTDLFCAWESLRPPKRLMSSEGRILDNTISWSQPRNLTEDTNDDHGLAMVSDNSQNPLILWLQQSSLKEDDTDLYYQLVHSAQLTSDQPGQGTENQEEPVEPQPNFVVETTNCLQRTLLRSEFLIPRCIPVIGGLSSFELFSDICATSGIGTSFDSSPLTPSVLTDLNLFLILGRHVSMLINGFTVKERIIDAQAGFPPYSTEEESITFGAASVADYLSFPLPLIICFVPVGKVRVGAAIQAGTEISFIQKSNSLFGLGNELGNGMESEGQGSLNSYWGDGNVDLPLFGISLPRRADEIVISAELGIGGESLITTFKGYLSGAFFLIGGLLFERSIPSDSGRVSKSPYISLNGYVNVGDWNVFERRFDRTIVLGNLKTYPGGSNTPSDPNITTSSLTVNSWKDKLIKERSTLMEAGITIRERLECVKKSFTGTGSVYEGKTVLREVSGDIYNDGSPSLAKSKSGEIMTVWTKALAASQLGSKVYSAGFDGSNWTNPVAITEEVDFHKEPAVVFDSAGKPMAVWSSASNQGLDYEQSSVEEILAALEKSDLMYAQALNGKWTAPKVLAQLPGADEQVALAAGPCGEIMAVWINQSKHGSILYSSLWDGSRWSTPVMMGKAILAEAPQIAYLARKPVAVWAQDTDDNMETYDDWRLCLATLDGGTWSSCSLSFEEDNIQKGN